MIPLLHRSRPGRQRTAPGYLGGIGAAALNADVEKCVRCLFWFGSVCMRVFVSAVVSGFGLSCQLPVSVVSLSALVLSVSLVLPECLPCVSSCNPCVGTSPGNMRDTGAGAGACGSLACP